MTEEVKLLQALRKRFSLDKSKAGKRVLEAVTNIEKAKWQGHYDAYAFVVNYLDSEIRSKDKSE